MPQFPVRTITVDQYEYLVEIGFYGDARVELLDGFVRDKMTHGSLAASIIMTLTRLLICSVNEKAAVRTPLPLKLRYSEPEPDIAIVVGPASRYRKHHPTAAETLVVIEVSDSTLAQDRGQKLRMYADAGIREYWIVNCVDRRIEIHSSLSDATGELRYKKQTIVEIGESASMKMKGQTPIEVDVALLFE